MKRKAICWILPALLAAACGRPAADRPLSPGGFVGAELIPPRPKPEFVLTGTDGYLTLLFFGYTHCPDVCPVHMANIAAVLKRLPVDVGRAVRVVFVTTDPARDTQARLRQWLDAFDPSFIGLTGTPTQLEQVQTAAGVLPAEPDTTAGPDYTVGHAAQVIAYTPDNLERVMYPFGTRQADWAHDIPLLVRMGARR